MRFKSIEVERFRQFRNAVAIHDLAAGLNIIAGNNEAGKSTLLQAVRAALFDRYSGNVGESFRPHGAAVSPRVRLVFDLDKTEYRLTKVFSRRRDGEATLEAADGRRWEGPEAEDYLAGLLGFSYASRGGSRPELQGLAGLLWVEQSRAYEPVDLTDQSRRQLHGVFEHDMRELLGGNQGEILHRRITALRGEYFDSRGKPRGDYRRLREQEAELRQRSQAIRAELGEYEDKVDRLEQQQTELLTYREERTLEKAEERLRSAQDAAERVTGLRAEVQAAKEQLARTQAERDVKKQAWDSRAKLIADLEEAQETAQTAEQAVGEKEDELTPLNDRLGELRNRLAELRSRRWEKDAELCLTRDAEALKNLAAEYARLDARLEKARVADAERRRCLAGRDAIRVTEEALSELKAIERTRELAATRLHAAATRLEYRLETGAEVRLGEEPLAGDGSVRLTRSTELRIEGVGRFVVIPGGEDLDTLRHKVEAADRRLVQGLAEIGAEDLTGAETLLRRREELDSRASQYAATIKGLAPEDLSALEDRLSSLGAQRDDLRHKLGENADREFGTDDLERKAQTLQTQTATVEGEVSDAEKLVQGLREMLAGLRAEQAAATRLAEQRAAALEQARLAAPDERLAQALAETEQTVAASSRRHLEAASQALAAEQPEAIELEVERSRRVFEDIGREIEGLEREIRDLEVELGVLGQQGLAEAVASVEADHAFAALQLEQAERRAKALDLLQRTLDAALRRAKEAIARPVTAKLVPYLHRLLPDAAPRVDEDLILTGIDRSGVTEVFTDLSIGTREQLAVLVRLAYADLLSEAGVPVTVILDDALVNSDDERRARMQAILYQAARRYQVLLLTCHGRDYRDTGGTFIRLENPLGEIEAG